jgi:hypothetical protein
MPGEEGGGWRLLLLDGEWRREVCPDEQAHVDLLMAIHKRLRHPSWDGALRSLPEPDAWVAIPSRQGWHRHFDDCTCFIQLVRG